MTVIPSQTQNHNCHALPMLVLDQRELNTHLSLHPDVFLHRASTVAHRGARQLRLPSEPAVSSGSSWKKGVDRADQSFWSDDKLFIFFLFCRFLGLHKVSNCPWFLFPCCRWLLHDICMTIKLKQKHIQRKLCGRMAAHFNSHYTWSKPDVPNKSVLYKIYYISQPNGKCLTVSYYKCMHSNIMQMYNMAQSGNVV